MPRELRRHILGELRGCVLGEAEGTCSGGGGETEGISMGKHRKEAPGWTLTHSTLLSLQKIKKSVQDINKTETLDDRRWRSPH